MREIEHNGKSQSIPAWSRETGIPANTIRDRLDRLGWTVERALTTPSNERFRPVPRKAAQVRPVPKLREDERGQAVVRWMEGGQRHRVAFGRWGDPASEQAYARWAAEWYATGGRVATGTGHDLSVAGLILRCLDWAEQTFRKHGRITSEVYTYRAALGTVADLYGDTAAVDFGPLQLRAVMAQWVAEGKAIKTINNYLGKVQRCWSRGVANGVIPAAVADALAHVERLVPGRTTAALPEPVRSAPAASVAAILPRLHAMPDRQEVLAAMVRLQLVTGMRPGEVCELLPEAIDRTREPWLYTPASGGKTLHLGKPRRVWIGPQGRAILGPWLDLAEPGRPVFRLRRRRGDGWRSISTDWYCQVIGDACRAAGVEVFTPHQLRHSRATEVHRRYEDDVAVAASLGASAEVARQVYVDDPADAVARRIAEEMG